MNTRALLGVASAVLFLVPACDTDPTGAGCTSVAGTFAAQSIPQFEGEDLVGFDVVGTGSTGPLAGEISASLTITHFDETGTMFFVGNHWFEGTSLGDLVTSDAGTSSPIGELHNRLTVTEGGSGEFETWGSVDMETGAVTLEYGGEVCPEA